LSGLAKNHAEMLKPEHNLNIFSTQKETETVFFNRDIYIDKLEALGAFVWGVMEFVHAFTLHGCANACASFLRPHIQVS